MHSRISKLSNQDCSVAPGLWLTLLHALLLLTSLKPKTLLNLTGMHRHAMLCQRSCHITVLASRVDQVLCNNTLGLPHGAEDCVVK